MERARKMHLLMVLLVIPISFPGKSDLRKRDKAFSFAVADINGEIYMGTVTSNSNGIGSCSRELWLSGTLYLASSRHDYLKINFMNECLFASTLSLSREEKI